MLRCILGGWNFCKDLKAHFQLAKLLLNLRASFPRWKTSHWSSFWQWPARQFPDTDTRSFIRPCLPLGSGLLWGSQGHHHGTAPADRAGGCPAPGSAQLPAGTTWHEGGSGKSLHITHSTTCKTDGEVTRVTAGAFQSPLCHLMENCRSTLHPSESPLICCPWASLCIAVPPPRCQECSQILHLHTMQMPQQWVYFSMYAFQVLL